MIADIKVTCLMIILLLVVLILSGYDILDHG